MPPPGHELLLGAICDQPDDDTLRLAYADWLDENGDPARAEVIRVEIEMARLGDDHPGWVVLRDRASALWKHNVRRWYGDLFDAVESYETRRRFPEMVSLNGGFVKQAPRLMARAPIRDVFLIKYKTDWKRFVRCPELARVEILSLNDETRTLDLPDAVALAASPYVTALRELSIWNSHVGPDGCRALAACVRLARLEHLDLGSNGVGDDGALALARQQVEAMR